MNTPSERTTVLYLSHATEVAGAEYSLARLIRTLDEARFEPVVALPQGGPVADLLRESGAEIHVLPLAGTVRNISKDALGSKLLLQPAQFAQQVWTILNYAARVARFAQQRRAKLIHTNSMKAHVYGGVAGRVAGLPVFWHLRDNIHPSYLPSPAVWAMRATARLLPNFVVAVSRHVFDQLHLPEKHGAIVHNGLLEREIEAFARHHNGRATPSSAPSRIGIVGRLSRWKGQDIFLRAAAKVVQRGHQAHFRVIGGPLFGQTDYEAELHALARKLGITDRVEFTGHVDDIPAALGALDVLVHASRTADPLPGTIIEGLAAGLPVIGSDGGGVPDMIAHEKTGLLSSMGNAAALADQIERLLDNPTLARRLAKAGQQSVREHFTAERTAREVEHLYETVLRQRAERSRAPSLRETIMHI